MAALNPLNPVHAQQRWEYPELTNTISIRDGRTGQRLNWDECVHQLAAADVVFLGESHNDDSTHQLQLAIYQAMLAHRDNQVVLAMEMFERDVQEQLNAYLAGKIDEAEFLKNARPWGNYQEAYRPLVEMAREVGRPVIASNFPRPLRMRLMQAGEQGLDALGADRALTPQTLLPNSSLYWKRADNATRGHAAFMAPATSDEQRLISTQSLWDNSMGESCVQAIDDFPDHQVVHLNGGFHSQYWDGTVSQVRQRRPELDLKTVAIQAVGNPLSAELSGAPLADFQVFVESRAKNIRDGLRQVVVQNEISYSLYLPAWASADRPAPLLIWLNEDGLMPTDGLELWKLILGDRVAIAVPRGIHLQQERDLSMGSRWFWPDQFPEDTSVAIETIHRVWQYTLNRFPIDPQQVVLAGEGSGATIAVATALLTAKMDLTAVANSPRQYSKLKDFPLPLAENWGSQTPPQRRLVVIGNADQKDWWQSELAAYQSVGIDTEWVSQIDGDPWESERLFHQQIFAGLGINSSEEPENPAVDKERKLLIAETNTAREKHWLRMLAERQRDSNAQIAIVSPKTADLFPEISRMEYADEPMADQVTDVPLCPGPFGGTTILVLDDRQTEESLADWLQLEANDPINQRSRFHRLRVANLKAGEHHLDNVLQKLLSENRKNVLVVPAKFYAGDRSMQELETISANYADQMTLHWLPGLGGNRR